MNRGIQIGSKLGLAVGLLSISLAFGSFLVPLGQVRAASVNLDEIHRFDSLISLALAKGQRVANNLATLYKIRKLAWAAPQVESAPASNSVSSSQRSQPVDICSGVFQGPTKRSSH